MSTFNYYPALDSFGTTCMSVSDGEFPGTEFGLKVQVGDIGSWLTIAVGLGRVGETFCGPFS